MKTPLVLPVAVLFALLSSGCVEEGQSPDCDTGGRGNLEDAGCLTPIGGSCLTEDEFKKSRPAEREVNNGDTVTISEDWETYQKAHPQCFDDDDE